MSSALPADLDYLVARLHGRRGQFAEADRLDTLCRLRTMTDLVRALNPHSRFTTVTDFQHGLIQAMVQELADFASQLTGAGSALMAWLRIRFQVENLKVLARAFATGKPLQVARAYLVPLPDDLSLDFEALVAADSAESFALAAPAGILRKGLTAMAPAYTEEPRPIVLEATLDRIYFLELLNRTRSLTGDARSDSMMIAKQEVDTFHLMLVARGRFGYDLSAAQLERFHVPGAGITRDRFAQMLAADTLREVASLAAGLALDPLPTPEDRHAAGAQATDAPLLETLAWNRYLRLARRAFRHSHMGLGAVVAFAAIRRIEVANLITLSEGIRNDMPSDAIRRRLIPRDTEAAHV
ncbi:MAG: V-type ATPase subunit [Pirellulaceae bacterium]|nr:V-type ATPase subunit [Pirellulaceae bacterium]